MESFWNGFEKQAAPGFVHGGYAMKMLRESKALKPATSVATGAAKAATQAATSTAGKVRFGSGSYHPDTVKALERTQIAKGPKLV